FGARTVRLAIDGLLLSATSRLRYAGGRTLTGDEHVRIRRRGARPTSRGRDRGGRDERRPCRAGPVRVRDRTWRHATTPVFDCAARTPAVNSRSAPSLSSRTTSAAGTIARTEPTDCPA